MYLDDSNAKPDVPIPDKVDRKDNVTPIMDIFASSTDWFLIS